jgi:hypothetical protein
MSLKAWLEQTDAGAFVTRSSTLKSVDRALEQYHATKSAADADRLKKALAAWIDEKGARWKTTDRNRWGAVERLAQQAGTLPGLDINKMSRWLDLASIEIMKQEGERLIVTLFRDQKLVTKPTYLADVRAKYKAAQQASKQQKLPLANVGRPQPTLPKSVVNPGRAQRGIEYVTSDSSKKVRYGAELAYNALQLLDDIVGTQNRGEIMAELTGLFPGFLTEFAAAATPIVGLITASGSVVYHSSQVLQKQCAMSLMADHINAGFSGGNPVAAMQAMTTILERQRNMEARNTALASAELGGKLLGLLVDGATLTNVGIAITTYLAKLIDLVLAIRRDVEEKNYANRKMFLGITLDKGLFSACPVLGAYYVCCVPTSVLVDRLLDNCGQGGWKGEVEYACRKHIEPLQGQARLLIKDSRFVIPKLQTFPGVMVKRELSWTEWLAYSGKDRARKQLEVRVGKPTNKYGHVSGPVA